MSKKLSEMSNEEKRELTRIDHEKVAYQYGAEYGIFIEPEDLDVYEAYEKEIPKGCTILDLGVGSGRSYGYFSKRGYKYIGYDFSEQMRNCAFELHGEFPYIVDDFVNLKKHFESNSQDTVFAIYSLFHLPMEDFKKALLDIYDILKDDGVFLVSCSLGDGEELVDEPYLGEEGKEACYLCYITKEELYRLLRESGFEIVYEKEKLEDRSNTFGENGNNAIFIITKKIETK